MSLSVERSTRQSEGHGWHGWAQRSHVSNNYPSYSNNRENMSACKADMPPVGISWLLFLVIFPVLVSTGTSSAKPKEDTSSEDIHPLALKEEMIRDRFQRFEDRVYRLREQLADPEPDNASRLGRVLQRAGAFGPLRSLHAGGLVPLRARRPSSRERPDPLAHESEDVRRALHRVAPHRARPPCASR